MRSLRALRLVPTHLLVLVSAQTFRQMVRAPLLTLIPNPVTVEFVITLAMVVLLSLSLVGPLRSEKLISARLLIGTLHWLRVMVIVAPPTLRTLVVFAGTIRGLLAVIGLARCTQLSNTPLLHVLTHLRTDLPERSKQQTHP